MFLTLKRILNNSCCKRDSHAFFLVSDLRGNPVKNKKNKKKIKMFCWIKEENSRNMYGVIKRSRGEPYRPEISKKLVQFLVMSVTTGPADCKS